MPIRYALVGDIPHAANERSPPKTSPHSLFCLIVDFLNSLTGITDLEARIAALPMTDPW